MLKKDKIQKAVQIKNRKASYEYEFLEKFVTGLVLKGTEIKSIRQGRASLQEAYCIFFKEELWITKMNIAPYEQATHYNHEPLRNRKLLLKRKELNKLQDKLKDVGLTIIPIKLFVNDRGFAKLEIALAKGKKLHDKRESIKAKDTKKDLQRQKLL